MAIARVCGIRSKDPNTKIGACIINTNNRIISTGYNGMPGGKDQLPWKRDGDFKNTKYAYVVHAESNAIINANASLKNSIIYVTLFPCNECAKLIVQAGITKVYYYDDKYHDDKLSEASRLIFDINKIEYIKIDNFDVKI